MVDIEGVAVELENGKLIHAYVKNNTNSPSNKDLYILLDVKSDIAEYQHLSAYKNAYNIVLEDIVLEDINNMIKALELLKDKL